MSDPKVKEMRDFQWKETEGLFQGMNDLDFENMLQEGLSQLPPTDEMTKVITPWRKAMTRILLGVALTTISFQMLQLQYILPTIGLLLMLLGFRTLRKENRWFHACWVISVLRLILSFVALSINATVWQESFYATLFADWLGYGGIVLTGVQLLGLWRGICDIKRKAGRSPRATAGALLFLCYVVISVLGLLEYRSEILFWILLMVYICVLWSLYRLSLELDDCGYVIEAAPVRLDDITFAGSFVLILTVGMSAGYLFFHQYPMEWSPVTEEVSVEAEAVKAELIELGFPERILEDLTEEEILACQGAHQVTVEEEAHPFNEGRQVTIQNGNVTKQTTVYDVKELQMTCVIVGLPNSREWRIFYHFCWDVNPGHYGTEAIQIWPPTVATNAWIEENGLYGRILYDDEINTYEAPFYSLGIYERGTLFSDGDTYYDRVATFSLPRKGERCRGYIVLDVTATEEPIPVSSNYYYIHQTSWCQYPVNTTVENYFLPYSGLPEKAVHCNFQYFIKNGKVQVQWWQK